MTTSIRTIIPALFLSIVAFAQSDRGTVTGTVVDPAGAVVPNAPVRLKNADTGSEYQTSTTATGNFTLASIPAGSYDLMVSAQGFNKHVHKGIQVQVALTVRLDVILSIGSTAESVTVTAEAPMLRTENAEASTNISGEKLATLPLNFGGGAGSIGAIRSQMAFLVLSPGISGSGTGARINGFNGNTFRVMIDGQDTTSGNAQARVAETQASVEAIEEFTLQTSNFAAEFGQALGGLFNFTIRSGTNRFRGSAFEYFTNEALNSRTPFTHIRPTSRKHDFGGTFSGPVLIPRLYNGRDKTFFFFNWEVFRNRVYGNSNNTALLTVPTGAYRRGDFSAALTGRQLGTDGLGRPIMENAIYDPQSNFVVNGATYRNTFPGNIIPQNRLDPVALRIQKYFPAPTNSNLVNNWLPDGTFTKLQSAPAVKIDHNFDSKDKMSFYYGYLSTNRTNQRSAFDSLPIPITATRFQEIYSHTTRLNFDRTLSPALLLHLGSGYIRYFNPDSAPPEVLNFDAAKEIGFVGSSTGKGFPRIANLATGNFGGMGLDIGPTNANLYYNDKWTSVASATWIRNNHSYKLGGEMRIDILTDRNLKGASGVMNFSREQTALPALTQTGQTLPAGTGVGLAYASFLLGAMNTGQANAVQDPQWRKTSWAFYVQDTWKVTRRLTVDYGLRWDYMDAGHEIWNRASTIGFSTPNPSVGGRPGALIYEGFGPGRCNCLLAGKYPYALGPRLAAAWQMTPKTVVRAGWGITYGSPSGFNYITGSTWYGVGFDAINFRSEAPGEPAALLRNGFNYNAADLYRTTLNPGLVPNPGQLNSATVIDPSWGRPPRIQQYTLSVQRELTRNLLVEGAWVGNRGVWLDAGGLQTTNAITDERLAAFGLSLSNAADRALLTQSISAPAVVARGFRPPYAGFPTTASLAQALRPYPQFSSGLTARNAALGNSWYDSLQVKVTKRYSHGLDLTAALSWQKDLNRLGAHNDPTNREVQKRLAAGATPLVFVTGFNYQLPKWRTSRLVNAVASGWTIGGILRYATGAVLEVPRSASPIANQVFRGSTVWNRVPGEPLFLKSLGCGCVDGNAELVLNSKAWTDVPQGVWGTSAAAYNDFRGQRTADEQMSFGRNFRVTEGRIFSIRAEFFNVFNRTLLPSPTVGSPTATVTRNSAGVLTGGFGFVNTNNAGQPRNGQIVARFQW